jgi:hypothetical protein
LQSSIRWEDRRRGAAGVHQPSLFGLRRHGAQGLVRPLAYVPGLWDEPASGPYCRPQHLALRNRTKWGRAGPSGANVARWGERRLSIRGDLSPAECQNRFIRKVSVRSSARCVLGK